MRITYLHQYFNTPAMSGGTRSYEMARRLVARGHEVNMIASWREPDARRSWFETEEAGIHVHWLPVEYSNHMSYARRLAAFFHFAIAAARRAASLPADVVFATSTPLTIALPGVYAARRNGVPHVLEVRDLWPEVPIAMGALRNPFTIGTARWLERFAYRNSVRVIALAPGMREGVIATGYPAERVAVIPNACDVADFQKREGWEALLAQHPWLRYGSTVLYAGAIGPANGVDYIPRLAAAIRHQDPQTDIRFAVLGDGRDLPRVKDIASQLGVLDTLVHFVGAVPKNLMPAWFSLARASIMTYAGPDVVYRDSVSNKYFDALAAARPLLANFRGFSTIIAESFGAGVILSMHDLDAAAQLCVQRLSDDGWLASAGSAAGRLARDLFDRDRLAVDFECVLQQAVSGGCTEQVGSVFSDLWKQHRAAQPG
jgi:glycosyltransferase involved in cell wall biosynthesis